MRTFLSATLGAIVLASPNATQDAPRFPVAQYSMGGNPYGLALGDLNGDGALDAVAAERFTPGFISVALGDGTGRFGTSTATAVGDSPEAVLLGHFDLDAHLDVITANEGSDDVTILHGDGNGGFLSTEHLPVGGTPTGVDAGDLNGDGFADIVTATQLAQSSAGYSVLLSDGVGGFATAVEVPLAEIIANRVRLEHVDGDAHLDLVHAFFGGTLTVALGDGAGGFGPAVNHLTGTFGDQWVDVADFDQDGNADLVTAGNLSNDGLLNVLFGDGLGGFGAPVSFPSGVTPIDGRAVDLDGDLATDVVVVNGDSTLSVHMGDGAGGFAPAVALASGWPQERLAIGDLDGNSALDLVVTNRNANSVSVVLAAAPGEFVSAQVSTGFVEAFAVGDFDGDGAADVVTAGNDGVEGLLGDGLGSFHSAGAPVSPGLYFIGIELRDMNANGNSDVVALLGSGSQAVGIWTGDGAGGFAEGSQVANVQAPRDLTVGDFDGDGRFDVATANALQSLFVVEESSVSVHLGDGAAGLGPAITTQLTGLPVAVAAADFDGNGWDDLAVGVNGGGALLASDGGGGFFAPVSVSLSGTGVDIAAGDANRDGELDLFFADSGFAGVGGNFTLLLGDGLGGFVQHSTASIDDKALGLALGDVDGDGLVDVTMTGQSLSSSLLIGDGTGQFTLAETYVAGPSTHIVDVNGDGRADWVSRRSGLAAHLNQEGAPAGVVALGDGTPGCNGTTGLLANSTPTLGSSTFGVIGTNGPALAAGFLFVTLGGSNPTGLLLNDVLFHLDLVSSPFLLLLGMQSDGGGTAFGPMPIPDAPGLADVTITAQVLWGWSSEGLCSPSFFNLSASPGLEVTFTP